MTPSQSAKLMEALDKYLVDARAEAERILKENYLTGKDTVLGEVFGTRGFMADPDMIFASSLTQANVDLISGIGRNYLEEVDGLTRKALEDRISPVDLEAMFNKANLKFESSNQIVAFDQVAKAQELGRNKEYAELGVNKVQVMVAPDACEICQPYHESIQDITGGDRPQYHIQCLCYDIPARDDAERLREGMEEDTLESRADFLDERYYSSASGLGEKERAIFETYQENSYDINSLLREGKTSEEIRAMGDAISDAPSLGKDMTFFRGVEAEGSSRWTMGYEGWSRSIGTSISDKGFMSTSLNRDFVTNVFPHDYMLEIHAPSTAKGIWMNSYTSAPSGELEYLFQRGTKMVIKDVVAGEVGQPFTVIMEAVF